MAQGGRVASPNPNPTIAALIYHSERVRFKANELTPDPHDILGAAADNHHKSMCQMTTALLVESNRGSSLIFREVDDFDVDESDEEGGTGREAPTQPETPDQLPPVQQLSAVESPTAIVATPALKKLTSEEDPTALLRRIRSQSIARSMSVRPAEGLNPRGSSHSNMSIPAEDDGTDGLFKDFSSMRAKSFLLPSDPQSSPSAADGMLAQIRGKSFKNNAIKVGEASPSGTRSDAASLSAGSGQTGNGSKSFSAGKASGALPGVSINDGPSLSLERPRSPAVAARAAPSGGLLSKLRQMVKH